MTVLPNGTRAVFVLANNIRHGSRFQDLFATLIPFIGDSVIDVVQHETDEPHLTFKRYCSVWSRYLWGAYLFYIDQDGNHKFDRFDFKSDDDYKSLSRKVLGRDLSGRILERQTMFQLTNNTKVGEKFYFLSSENTVFHFDDSLSLANVIVSMFAKSGSTLKKI